MSSSSSAGAKTPHRRRRKVPATPQDKENTARGSTNQPTLLHVLDDDDDDITLSFNHDKTRNADNKNDNDEAMVIDNCLLEFRECLKSCPLTVPSSLFEEQKQLDESVLRSSLFPNAAKVRRHVQEHAPALLSISRKLIKEATNTEEKAARRWLFVAVHCLRAVVGLQDQQEIHHLETCLRLLYHLITTASEHFSEDYTLGLIVISGMEGLQNVLLHYSCSSSNGKAVRFQTTDKSLLLQSDCCIAAVVPTWKNKNKNASTMTLRQVATILFKAYQACASAQHHLWWHSLAGKSPTISTSRLREISIKYGNYAVAVMQWKDTTVRLHPPASLLQLFQGGYLPWLSFLADSGDEECIKDLPAHGKASHRLLWDMAGKLRGASHLFPDAIQRENACLRLRQQAIELLLPETKTDAGRAVVIDTQCWESACSYAWKAASVHIQQADLSSSLPVTRDSTLGQFHETVSSKLDSFVSSSSTTACVSYLEYCVYRALHCGIRSKSEFLPPKQHDVGTTVLTAALLGIQARHRLTVNGEENEVPLGDGRRSSGEIVDSFASIVVCQWATLPADSQARFFKLLSTLSLHRTLFQALKRKSNHLDKEALHIISLILRQCIGPITSATAKACTEDASKKNLLLDTTVECYIRPLAAFGRLAEIYRDDLDSQDFYERLADDTIQEIHRRFFRADRLPPEQLEKCAKSVAMIARQRSDSSRAQSSILPTLYSLPMFRFLSEQETSDYQLAARLTHLASSLQSMELFAPAMMVLAYVIAEELPRCYNDGTSRLKDWKDIDFIRFLASHSKSVFSPISTSYESTALARSSIRRLVSIAIKSDNEHENFSSIGDEYLQGAWEAFLASTATQSQLSTSTSLGKTFSEQNSIISMLSDIILANISTGQSKKSVVRLMFILVEMMGEVGCSFVDFSSPEHTRQIAYCKSLARQLTETIIPQIVDLRANLVSSMVKVYEAICLLPDKNIDYASVYGSNLSSPPSSAVIDHVVQTACEAACANHNIVDCDGDLAISQHWLSAIITYFCLHIRPTPENENRAEFFQQCQTCMDKFRNSEDPIGDDVQELFRKAFLWTLCHFQWWLEANGDSTRSVVVAHWSLELVNEADINESSWFYANTATAIPLSLPSQTKAGLESQHISFDSFAQIELHIATTRARIVLGHDENIQSAMKEVQYIEAQIVEEREIGLEEEWLLSNISLVLGEYAAATGAFVDSLKHLQESTRHCMTVISSCKRMLPQDESLAFWESVARSTLLPRSNRRYVELLSMRSKLYSKIGDHRKALAYLVTLSDFMGFCLDSRNKELGPSLEQLLDPCSELHGRNFRRLEAELRCSASSLDSVTERLRKLDIQWPQSVWSETHETPHKLQAILDVISVGDIVYGESIKSTFQPIFHQFYEEALQWYQETVNTGDLIIGHQGISEEDTSTISAKIAIREIRCLLHRYSVLTTEIHFQIEALCHKVIDNLAADASDRAWAHYYKAEIHIAALRESRGLERLWHFAYLTDTDTKSLAEARRFLEKALSIHSVGSDILSRIILRSLALVAGPHNNCRPTCQSAGELVLLSIGQSYRQVMVRSLTDAENGSSLRAEGLLDLFSDTHCYDRGLSRSNFDGLLQELHELTPPNWKFVAATLCPSGELLISSIEKDPEHDKMATSIRCFQANACSSVYDDIIAPLDDILQESHDQLFGMDAASISERFSKESTKRKWWGKRHELDTKLQELLERAEDSYFSSLHLSGESGECMFQDAEAASLPIGNLASKFEEAVEIEQKSDAIRKELRKLTVPRLKDLLRQDFGFSDAKFRKMRKENLIELILYEREKCKKPTKTASGSGCLFLILDENLHRFPFEGMPSLAGHPVCRVPSLAFVLSTLREKGVNHDGEGALVDASCASFLLDPESNLLSTRNRLRPILDEIQRNNGWTWDAAVGRSPPASFFEQGLVRKDGLFMYFGHGGAQTCFSRKHVEGLLRKCNDHDVRACSATVILMGCSSGRLVSINRKHSRVLDQIPLHYEPEGIALSYLCAGSPCVVGNLWDVTDHDIDRYSTALLERFLQQDDGESLANCVAKARTSCKLRYINGCAPVCYGVPVHLMK